MPYAPITVISDCKDDNARGRVLSRLASLLPESQITFVGVNNEIEATINLIDTLDAFEDRKGVVLVNVAPRNGAAKRWPNGTPFGEAMVKKTQIFSTVDGLPLGFLAHVLGHKLLARVYDIPEVVLHLGLTHEVQNRIIKSQFRSFDFLPRLVAARMKKKDLPFKIIPISPLTPPEGIVAWKDCFGNLKTLDFTIPAEVSSRSSFRERLKDVPDGELSVVVGSSGLGGIRFLELVIQGGSAADKLGGLSSRDSWLAAVHVLAGAC